LKKHKRCQNKPCNYSVRLQQHRQQKKHKSTKWVLPKAIDKAAHSQEVGLKLVEYFEVYTGIIYKLPQNDKVTVPDFATGAMEN